MRTRFGWIVPLLCLLSGAIAFADGPREKDHVVRTFSIDSGYVPLVTTNASSWNFTSEIDGLGGALLDVVSQKTFVGKHFVGRLIWGLVLPAAWIFPSYSLFVSNHELGHGSRTVAVGLNPTYAWTNSFQHPTILTFFGEGLIRFGSGAATSSAAGSVRGFPTDWGTVVAAAGMNNSQMYGEYVADRADLGLGHFLDAETYILAKTDSLRYALVSQGSGGGASDDVANLRSYYNGRGFGVNYSDFMIGSAVAYLGSFTTYAQLWAFLRYFGTGDGGVRGFHFGPVRAPDIAFFMNREGLSYRLTTGLVFGNWGIPMQAEVIYKGVTTVEVGSGITYGGRTGRKDLLSAKAFINSQLGISLQVMKEFAFGNWGYAALATGFFTADSLEGSRTGNFLLSDSIGFDGWARFGVVF